MSTPTANTPASSQSFQGATPEAALIRLFTGRVTAGAGISSGIVVCTVVKADAFTVTVTITGFSTPSSGHTPTITAYYEPRPQASRTTKLPPAGIQCFVGLPVNEPQKIGVVVAFIGWPS